MQLKVVQSFKILEVHMYLVRTMVTRSNTLNIENGGCWNIENRCGIHCINVLETEEHGTLECLLAYYRRNDIEENCFKIHTSFQENLAK